MKLNPEKSALLVIDMQEGFLNPESPTYIPMAWDTVPACAAVQDKARELGIPVYFIIRKYAVDGSDVEFTRYFAWKEGGKPCSSPESPIGWNMPDAFTVKEGDTLLVKPRYSAFFDTNLDAVLRRKGIDTVVVSVMHSADFEMEQLRKYVREGIIAPVLKNYGFDIADVSHIHINPTGNFVIGGPDGDTGLTGRKIIVDTYGGYFSHGGGAFSGKDPTKVDRSGAYMARYMAKNIVAAGLAKKCEVQIAYAIGISDPVSVMVDTFGTGIVSDDKISDAVNKLVDLRTAAIIKKFDLRRPIYKELAAYGHMGREDINAPWEERDLSEALKNLI